LDNVKRTAFITVIIIFIVATCCCVLAVAAGYAIYKSVDLSTFSNQGQNAAQSTSVPFPFDIHATPIPIIPLENRPTPTTEEINLAQKVLNDLENTTIPISNLIDLASRLQGKHDIPLTLPAPITPLVIGDQKDFWVTNTDNNNTFKITATLKYITNHVYFWVEEGVGYNQRDLVNLVDTFESSIYPTDREFFGSEWTPGVDNDPHLYILLGSNLGDSLAGYFSSFDEYTPEAHKYSNGHEMFILNADGIDLGQEFTYGVLAHEFQHMIHWYRDLNEDTWMNEGFSELAALINGYDPGGFDYSYTSNTDMQLNDWASSVGENDSHYGASFLFMTYFLDRFGEDVTKTLIGMQENGMESIDKLLSDLNKTDPTTGNVITANDLFADWAVTNFLNDRTVGDGRYSYRSYTGFSPASYTDKISDCTGTTNTSTVFQYGVDYIQFECDGKKTISFQGNMETKVLKDDPYSGEYAFWSFKGDESNMTLTREFDFTQVSGPIQLSYQTWYDLEQDYDYAYVEVSEDGSNWTFINTPSGTDRDVSGNSYGWGYNGSSNGWIEEQVDLSDYAGKKVQIRFEYITDAAVNGEGFMVDDISIPAIKYFEDFEGGSGGWDAAGFVRIANHLPQTFKISLITYGSEITVTPIELDKFNKAEIPVDFSNGISKAVLVISGTTQFTRQPADYSYGIR
jgi:immune inhibitor A